MRSSCNAFSQVVINRGGPTHGGWCHDWAGGEKFYKKTSQASQGKQISQQHLSMASTSAPASSILPCIYNEKPFLTADSGPQGISERNATLLCHTHPSFDIFILCRGGNASFPQNCSRQDHSTFLISPVSPGHRRTYRCFGSYKHSSYLWSLPSDLLEFSVSQSSTSNYRLENHIRLILAIVILLGLGALLLDAWSSRESP
uniref:leukocyte immunoglobulin-like receptor subfamily A member 2 n=1 Tax=Myodes glareolus TaxID=447135 RepID=UPI00201FC069|nr:leukocyte immunoglobulin-like receptor subfamily A member 2 [Myodes glareolus]